MNLFKLDELNVNKYKEFIGLANRIESVHIFTTVEQQRQFAPGNPNCKE